MIDDLGERNPILKGLLQGAISEIEQSAQNGRRLLQREEFETTVMEALIDHPLVKEYGASGIPGVTVRSF